MIIISAVLVLCAAAPFIRASPTLLATPGVIAGFGFENSSPADGTGLSGNCTVSLGNGQFSLPSSQCVYGSCMLLNDTAINCTRPNGGFSQQSQPYTVAAWLAPHITPQITATEMYFSVFDNVSNALEFGINCYGMMSPMDNYNSPYVFHNGNLKQALGSSYAFPFASAPSNWTHVTFVFNGTNVFLYINATLQNMVISPTNLTLTSLPYAFGIGSRATWGGSRVPFQGFIDELGVFNIALNQSQIFALYNVANSVATAAPTNAPTRAPSNAPTNAPTRAPTNVPTHAPTSAPTNAPASPPTSVPSAAPTSEPSVKDYLMSEGIVSVLIWIAIFGALVVGVCAVRRCCCAMTHGDRIELQRLTPSGL